ncbi:MAG: N-acetylglucosamine-6-phosphate deacetylase [Kiritimatiellae bacterium]|nr:N-acetylglucosamine-6-phosphate deacetylase [Kiritimatiellia bacterium]
MEPVWVDLQVNGYAGVDFNAPGLTEEAVRTVTERLTADGTAVFLPTLVTGDPEMLIATVRTVMAARRRYAVCERSIPGFFMEGPFISNKPGAVGTHPVEWVRPPDLALFGRFQDAAEGLVKMVNVAAEVPGMPEFVRELSARGVTVSLGHQLAKSPAEIEGCIAAGARAFTHLGNGIPNEVDRHDNIIFTALVEDRASVMFIPDGHHLPDTMLKLYARAVPISRLIAVSDAQYPAGMPPGEYEVCGAHARLEPSGLLWNPARNCLVGATTPIARMMTLLQERVGLTEAECLRIGRDNPLALVGLG